MKKKAPARKYEGSKQQGHIKRIISELQHDSQEISAEDCFIDTKGLEEMVHETRHFRNKTVLQSLGMSRNSINASGAKYLQGFMRGFHDLKILDLSINPIGDAGAKCILDAFKFVHGITELDMSRCEIGDATAAILGAFLGNHSVNKNMKTMFLYGNLIGDEGAAHIITALNKNKTLLRIDLYGNKITSVTAQAIESLLKTNKKIQRIDLGHNSIDEEGLRQICDGLQISRSLKRIDLQIQDGLEKLDDELKGNLRASVNELTLWTPRHELE